MSGQKQDKQESLVEIKRLKIEAENFFCISNIDEMRPFFMSKTDGEDEEFKGIVIKRGNYQAIC